ncbi:MAG TPA: hypothetical protein VMF53_11850 [Alphaproteobacteria bacterium]|nr:hypothetical protein [Alphaproteobacteria bacterium]
MALGRDCGCGTPAYNCKTEFQYAVKVVCGVIAAAQPGTDAQPGPLAPGHYYTAVNIHNPAVCGCVTPRMKVAQALPWGADKPMGTVTPYYSVGPICADQAIEIDNPQILGLFPRATFVKGYLVIASPQELDVVAVYTAAQDYCGPCSNLFTERVPARCVPVCEDLVLPIDTGVAAWQTVATPAGTLATPQPVVVLSPLPSAWKPAPSGSAWVSAAAGDASTAASGSYTYQLGFELCSGYSNPVLQLQGLADNAAQVFLNNTGFGSLAGFGASPPYPTLSPPAASFLVGANVLKIVVTNGPGGGANPTGFAVAGLLRVAGGKCPCADPPLLPAPTAPQK